VNARRTIFLTTTTIVTLLASAACGGGSAVSGSSAGPALGRLTIHVAGPAESHSSPECFLSLVSKVVDGGTMTYCLQKFTGRPGRNALVRSSGTVTFALPKGQIRSAVDVQQKFGSDGEHAGQKLTGMVTGGTGTYEGVRGTIFGGGANEEFPPGTITDSNLHYLIHFG